MAYGSIVADNITTSDGYTIGSSGAHHVKNRIINGAMNIDQRYSGSANTPTNGAYTLDRWYTGVAQTSKLTIQQNAGSITPPTGFANYLGITSSSAYSVISTDFFYIMQVVEGLNTIDLAWGTSSAKNVTVSFWVRSSLTGTFGGVIQNYAGNRSYPFTYTISSANTWEQKSITIPGDTTGTWPTTNTGSLCLLLSVGAGSSRSGPASAWAGAAYYAPTGATSVVGTSGATFYVTGVQLEAGSQATSFDYRHASVELQMCQRYLPVFNMNTIAGAFTGAVGNGMAYSTTAALINYTFKVTPRVPPTGITVSAASHFSLVLSNTGTAALTGLAFGDANYDSCILSCTGASSLTAGNSTFLRNNGASVGQILFTGCEL
jgi:hypothetical protein